MYKAAKIVIEGASLSFDKEYTYLLPEKLTASAGCRVRIPFGRGNRSKTGLITEVFDMAERPKSLKPVLEILDSVPVLNSEGLFILRYLKECTFCTWFDAFRTLIPAGISIKPKLVYRVGDNTAGHSLFAKEIVDFLKKKKNPVPEEKLLSALGISANDENLASLLESGAVICEELLRQRVLDEKVAMVRLCENIPRLTKTQKKVAAFLDKNGDASLKEICYFCGCTRTVPDNMRTRGAVEYYDVPRFRNPYGENKINITPPPALSHGQQQALDILEKKLSEQKIKPALLYGVTGSGKTEVFLALIQKVLSLGRKVIVLVPEISLTAQTVRSFHSRFGGRVAVLHSGLSMGERMDEWRRIKAGDADIVVGTRSAVFAPIENIGLIVIDEEQEHTYHSEKSPRFHTRDIAKLRCSYNNALLLLASATPSVESFYNAKKGNYTLVELPDRFGSAKLPDVYLSDMRESENLSSSHIFSSTLLDELHYNLKHGEQSILLLNRRGYSTLIRCPSCNTVAECPHCSVSMTYHAANSSLICHYCGYTKPKAEKCSKCGGEMIQYSGHGTQKIAEELEKLYPNARILRVDMDTTMSKFSHEKLFSSFSAKEYDIMVGTQMVAKGLNFPHVTLVGVLAADQSLYAMDFRSFERSFSLLTQVIGRSGRGEFKGRALIQTFSPDNPIIALAANQDYNSFYEQEIKSRKLHLYPPFCTMAGIGFVGTNLGEVQRWSRLFLKKLEENSKAYPNIPLRVLGPVDADTLKAAGKYRQKIIIKCKNTKDTRALFAGVLEWFYNECGTVTAFIDMYYDRI